MNFRLHTLLATTALAAAAGHAGAAPRVAADILPVQSIAARVMAGVGAPDLIVPPGASPHGYAMRPSEARMLGDADIVFWSGKGLAPWLEGPIESLAGDAIVLDLTQAPGVRLLAFREGATFEPHVHDDAHDHTEGAHDEHDHDEHDHDEHGDEDHAHEDHAHEAEADHHHEGNDPHIWLDPENAVAMAEAMADVLATSDPDNAETYRDNAASFQEDIANLETEISEELAPVSEKHFVVFHDGYHYFEARFGVEASGAISLSDASTPSAARVAEIRDRIRSGDITCVFAEPQFDPALIRTVIEGTEARAGTLDPLGSHLTPGPDLYPELLRNLADNMSSCLAGE